jgi:uncharacterized protein (DUF983 family)
MTTIENINNNNMAASTDTSNPGIFKLLACKCPRCRKGDMFEDKNPWHLRKTMKMNKECPTCGQPLDIEVGFYFGASYVAYAFTVAISVVTIVAWSILIGFSLYDNRIFYWLTINAILLIVVQPYLMRVSRTGWLAFFVHYDKEWRTSPPQPLERTNKDQENNW